MYQTKHMSYRYNTKEKPTVHCTAAQINISHTHKGKNVTRIDCIKQHFKSSNRKVFMSYTVILLTVEEYMNEQLLMHNYRRGIVEVFLESKI